MEPLTGLKSFDTPFSFTVGWSVRPPSPSARVTVSGPGGQTYEKTLTPGQHQLSFELMGPIPGEGDAPPPQVIGFLVLSLDPNVAALDASIKVKSNESFVGTLTSWSTTGQPPSIEDEPRDPEPAPAAATEGEHASANRASKKQRNKQ